MSQPTAPVLSFTFPIERAGNAIQSLPAGTYTIKITGLVTKLHKVAELAGALANTRFEDGGTSSEKRIYLDLTELEGLQFIGRWGTRFSRENSEYNGFRNASYLVSISLPLGIEFIGNDVFSGCTNLKELTIPYGVQAIGDNTFNGCSSLKELVIPDGVESIGDNAFGGYYEGSKDYGKIVKRKIVGCSSLEKLQLPATLRSIGKEAFLGCTSLKELTIPDGVESISDNAFSVCSSLEKLQLLGTLRSIEEKDSYGYTNPKAIPDDVKSIMENVFEHNLMSLKKPQPPASLRSIGKEAFLYCTNLKELTIPDGVESIGDNAFGNCSNLEKIEMKGETPPDVSKDSFPSGVTIYVPAASVEDYRRKLPYNHIEAIEDN